ncbi:MAG: hypothetical protein ACREQJ_04800 [Candidatus Binatia bacterium]
MKPSPNEVLGRACEILTEVVLPEVRSDYVRTQLQNLVMAIEDIRRADGYYPRLAEENDDTEALLASFAADFPEASVAPSRARSKYPTLGDAEERNRELREALTQVIRAIGDRRPEVSARIRAHLQKYLARDAASGVKIASAELSG